MLMAPAKLRPVSLTYHPTIGGYEKLVHDTLGNAASPADGWDAAMAAPLAALAAFPAQSAALDNALNAVAASTFGPDAGLGHLGAGIAAAGGLFKSISAAINQSVALLAPAQRALDRAISNFRSKLGAFKLPAAPSPITAPPEPKKVPAPPGTTPKGGGGGGGGGGGIIFFPPPDGIVYPCDPFVDELCDPFLGFGIGYGPGPGPLPFDPAVAFHAIRPVRTKALERAAALRQPVSMRVPAPAPRTGR